MLVNRPLKHSSGALDDGSDKRVSAPDTRAGESRFVSGDDSVRQYGWRLITIVEGEGALHRRLFDCLRSLILEGVLADGTRLPSSRQIARNLNISRNTALRAVERLVDEGLASAKRKSGYYVNAPAPVPATVETPVAIQALTPRPFEIGQAAVDLFPHDRWRKLQADASYAERRSVLHPSHPGGDPLLRDAITRFVCPSRGIACDPEQVIVTSSVQLSLHILTLAAGPAHQEAVVEDPGYPLARAAYSGSRCRVIPVPIDSDGLQVAIAQSRAPLCRQVYVTPTVQFPTCGEMSTARRNALTQWMVEVDGLVVEDDYDAHFRFDGARPASPMIAQCPSHVAYIGTFNRMLFPGLRLAFMILPHRLVERARAAQITLDGVPSFGAQLVLRKFIEEGGFARQIRLCRNECARRRRALLEVLAPFWGTLFDPSVNPAGLHLVLRTKTFKEPELVAAIRVGGFAVSGLKELAAHPDTTLPGLLLGFAAFPAEEIAASAAQLRDSLTWVERRLGRRRRPQECGTL